MKNLRIATGRWVEWIHMRLIARRDPVYRNVDEAESSDTRIAMENREAMNRLSGRSMLCSEAPLCAEAMRSMYNDQ